ncbi:MAG: hypothetical protein ACJ74J_03505 [Blastocatellia bacterium]
MKALQQRDRNNERGMALITALLATTMLLALGMAVVFSATSDAVTTKSSRLSEEAFFVADAGIDIARKALTKAFQDRLTQLQTHLAASPPTETPYRNNPPAQTGQFPDVQLLPDPDSTDGQSRQFYRDVLNNAVSLCNVTARNNRLRALNDTSFTVAYGPLSGTVSLVPGSATQATQVMVFRYNITVTGQTGGGGGATATVSEVGRLSTNIVLTASGAASTRAFKFSGFGAFFDNGDTQATAPLAAGTFSGPVHTNTHFAFDSSRQVTFRNLVTQVDSQIRYDNNTSTSPNHAIPTADITGIDISAEGYKRTNRVPLPTNNFSQEYSVINSTGVIDIGSDGLPVDKPAVMPTDSHGNPVTVFDSTGRVTATALKLNMRTGAGAVPTVSSGVLANGVYIASSDWSSVTGSGIYVKGNADDIQIYGDTNGDQVYVVKQGSTTTTVRTSYANNTTTVSQGSSTKTLSGVFKDKADPTSIKNGAMLFVDGSISSLRGGVDSSGAKPAIASQTRLTIAANRNIYIDGDLKYASPVANSDGTPVSNIGSITNVLGIFTNDGNVLLSPTDSYTSAGGLGLEMHAAVVAFNSNTGNDTSAPYGIEGSIVYDPNNTAPGSTDRWRLVGSRVQSKISTIGYSNRDIFYDARFSGGSFAPPFFPGTDYEYAPAVPTTLTINSIATPGATAMSWFRNNN